MKGDYNRYVAEYAEGDLKKQVSDGALAAYKEASIALGLALNFFVFYYEVMNDHDTACKIADEALTNANKELPNIDEDAEKTEMRFQL